MQVTAILSGARKHHEASGRSPAASLTPNPFRYYTVVYRKCITAVKCEVTEIIFDTLRNPPHYYEAGLDHVVGSRL